MNKLPIGIKWNICTPTLFRFINSEYVEAFFKDGSLRLSSFSQFKKHKDEQRFDKHEGKLYYVIRTSKEGGYTIEVMTKTPDNAYVLSASMIYDKDLQTAELLSNVVEIPSSMFSVSSSHLPVQASFLAGEYHL